MGLTAFRQAYFASGNVVDYESFAARQMRYQILWSMFENTAYEEVHSWVTRMKTLFGMYKNIRSLYSPAYRLGSFYSAHLWGGPLSLTAEAEGAIPIETDHDNLRVALAALWKATNFGTAKDIFTLRGCIEGDLILRVHDDVEKGRVYLERLDPSTVTKLILDSRSNVKAYTVEEKRSHPDKPTQTVTYRLEVTRDGANVVYQTFLNNNPYSWNGQPEIWEEAYTFIPLVLIKHIDVGLDWGWSELHAVRSKVREINDLASMVSDQIRKTVNPVWLMPGKPQNIVLTGASPTTGRPMPSREEIKTIWNWPEGSRPEPMIAPLNLADALKHIDSLLEEVEREYPELQTDIWASGATSGRALRVARQRVEAKVHQRRAGYDAGLVKLQMMALSIGGMRGYKGYDGLTLDSYEKGDLDHSIADRPVFAVDPMDKVEVSQVFWTAAKTAVDAGADLGGYLKEEGWSDEQITRMVAAEPSESDEKELGIEGEELKEPVVE